MDLTGFYNNFSDLIIKKTFLGQIVSKIYKKKSNIAERFKRRTRYVCNYKMVTKTIFFLNLIKWLICFSSET